MSDRELDPRFDPRYQRGFDPALHEPRDDRRSSLSRPTVPRHQVPQPAPHIAVPPEVRSSNASDVAPHAQLELDRQARDDGDAHDDARDDEDLDPSGRNPYRVALLVGSLASLLVGLSALWATANVENEIYARQDTVAIFVATVAGALAPALISAAVIGFALWVALGAVLLRLPRHD